MSNTINPSSEQYRQIEHACSRLVLDAAHFADSRQFRRLAELFVEQGVLYRPTTPEQPLIGREAIFASYNARPAQRLTRHLCTNLRVDIESETRARVHCYAQVFGADSAQDKGDLLGAPLDGRMMIGEFDDLCVLEQGRWLIAERHARFVMQLPL